MMWLKQGWVVELSIGLAGDEVTRYQTHRKTPRRQTQSRQGKVITRQKKMPTFRLRFSLLLPLPNLQQYGALRTSMQWVSTQLTSLNLFPPRSIKKRNEMATRHLGNPQLIHKVHHLWLRCSNALGELLLQQAGIPPWFPPKCKSATTLHSQTYPDNLKPPAQHDGFLAFRYGWRPACKYLKHHWQRKGYASLVATDAVVKCTSTPCQQTDPSKRTWSDQLYLHYEENPGEWAQRWSIHVTPSPQCIPNLNPLSALHTLRPDRRSLDTRHNGIAFGSSLLPG